MPTCPDCSTPLAADQRYCLGCGRRVGALRLDWRALLAPATTGPAPARVSEGALTMLPSPRLAAALLMTVMGFGVVVAGAATSDTPRALAATPRGAITIQMPPVAATPAPQAPDLRPSPTPEPVPAPEPVSEPPAATPAPEEPAAPAPEDDEPVIPAADDEPDGPEIKHVFVIALGAGTYEQWFGAGATGRYLADELAPQGTLLAGYRATSQGVLANRITMISGQAANPQTDAGCPLYTPFDGSEGCVYPLDAYTLPDQLVAFGDTWKAYVEGHQDCSHPDDGAADDGLTSRDPFMYFQTITTAPDCAAADVGLDDLAADLADEQRTATYSWISPAPDVADPDAWLRLVAGAVLQSKAYADDGLLAIVPSASGNAEDPVTGALLLSADHVAAGAIDTTEYDHLSLLRSIEDLFALRHLEGAGGKKVASFVSPLLH
ncbi:MAG: hypothetical protein ACJ762_03240 [Solirubrobacteraceae bacterium]